MPDNSPALRPAGTTPGDGEQAPRLYTISTPTAEGTEGRLGSRLTVQHPGTLAQWSADTPRDGPGRQE
jgi:hypothetical protein